MARKRPVGRELYLFQDDAGKSVDNLVISSHGEYMPRPEFGRHTGLARNIPGLGGWIEVPAGVTLYLYGPHKSALGVPGMAAVMSSKLNHLETLRSPQKIRNYRLSKFQDGYSSETYGSIEEDIDQNRRCVDIRERAVSMRDQTTLAMIAENFPVPFPRFDILTIRNRAWMYSITLHDVLKALRQEGYRYSNIHCVFCRSPIVGPKPLFKPNVI
ncbi:hypothetical protein D3C77_201010 [compost metagenome]